MSNRWLSAEERRALKGFLLRYSPVVAHSFARGLLQDDPGGRTVVDMREQLLLNYGARLAIAAWGAGEHRCSPAWFGFSLARPRRILVHSSIGAALGAMFVLAVAATRSMAPRDNWERRIASLSPAEALLLFNLTGLTEEIVWRGWTFSELDRIFEHRSARVRAVAAIGLSALLFSSAHLSNLAKWPQRRLVPQLQQLALAGALGLIAGYWRHVTGSIAPGLVLHDVMNLLLWRTSRSALLHEMAESKVSQ